ncbi:HAD-IA family hydrolase [Streptosporangium sp. LJ11]|uniref:HAD family hydrolase n=1 Tax=Streptosporangium sp. LJ11 TaxID=3436927 RepID=UPI003F79C361
MIRCRPTHLLFDFFGTLVDYSPSRTGQGYQRSHALLHEFGGRLGYERFLDVWSAICARFDQESALDDREFSMADITTAFLREVLPSEPTPGQVDAFVRTYLAEWNAPVRPLAGIDVLLSGLSSEFRLAVVSNTHSPTMVPEQLTAMGVLGFMDAVVLSVNVGRRKPHADIYRAALRRLAVSARDVWFIGDSYEADYAGPRRMGMEAFLIDPQGRTSVPPHHRLDTVFDLPHRLSPTLSDLPAATPPPRT